MCPVQIALEAAHARAAKVGRPLHRYEARWVVRHEFRTRFIGLSHSLANTYADRVMESIRLQIG